MKIFYSAKDNTFFNEVFHGPRTIQVPDPEWVRPTVSVADPGWSTPSIEVPNPALVESDDVTPKTIWVLDSDAVAPMIDVPDNAASPPLITVPNPACLLPPALELIEVSQDEHDEIFRVLALGGSVLAPGENGRPSTAPTAGPTVEELKSRERAIRDRVLLLTDPLISRHRDEVEAERLTTLTAEQYKQLQGYRQDLRDWPESVQFPGFEYRPEQPAWLAELIQ
ncbi:phage tail assembly chaperone [Pseudomonas grimontii]|uniref:phage tail assembly chaperone n=1 Tax=Pseudomonas grimontii TaxID=129847 RepID=UPI0021698B5A|nr:phage tail assembly chaperone [Pseudomonas grimontii]MCS3512518.1 hypothetical protein [Pseudomonas grimontii]